MKEFYICDCTRHENKIITSNFVVVSKQIKPKKTGEPYLALTLGDRSGQLEAKMWDNVEEVLNAFEQDDFLKVKGLVNKYKNRFQLTIHKLRKLGEMEIEFSDYLPKTTKNIDELWQTLADLVASFQNPHLKALVQGFMSDPEIAAAYRNAPAAKTLHHAYIGGLLDHVVSLFRSCDLVCRNYPQVNRDLLLTGAFLHDIGKIHDFLCRPSLPDSRENVSDAVLVRILTDIGHCIKRQGHIEALLVAWRAVASTPPEVTTPVTTAWVIPRALSWYSRSVVANAPQLCFVTTMSSGC